MNLKFKQTAALTLVASSAFLSACGQGYHSGEGTQIGTIVGLGTHGAVCPTNEGEVALPNFRGGNGGSSTLHFTVIDPDVLKQLQKAQEDRSVVKVEWERRSFSGPCTMESNFLAKKVTELNEHASNVNPKNAVINANDETQIEPGKAVTLNCLPGANNTFSCAMK